MKSTISIRMGMIFSVLLLAGSCERAPEPDAVQDSGAIGFEAGIALIRDDVTKSSTLNENTSFANTESFRVFARRHGEGRDMRLFGNDGTLVTWSGSAWTYSPASYWYWVNASNYYDFLAVSPDPDGVGQSERMTDEGGDDIPGNLAVQKSYSLTRNGSGDLQPGTDLLMAGTRCTGANAATRTDPVRLTFQHVLCAVRVKVVNESSTSSLTLNSLRFDNLIHSANAKVTIDAMGQPEFSWIDTRRRSGAANDVYVYRNTTVLVAGGVGVVGATYEPAGYDLFIPADLTAAVDGSIEPERENYATDGEYDAAMTTFRTKLPHLIVSFTPAGDVDPTTRDIVLRDVPRSRYGVSDPISEWEPGVKYTYNILIRVDGDVLVTVITTDWDSVTAETPGILID